MTPTNGFGNGLSSFDALLNDPDNTDLLEKYNQVLGDVIALRIALRFLLRSGAVDGRNAEQVADALRENKTQFEHQWIAASERQPPWAVARYRSFAETTDEIINGLRAIGRNR
ncbi:MAG: hypothetical protein F4107_09555 [Gemmatimonadetes bacterium]|nr:hypothetical protein [Gemmatimonadota bacterium]MXX33808.1 hypothetical protein [Gemmatimonadota bacterium]MYD13296.1 hypothetical protein [Gemmatimonadota bacterium]MYI66162.1 hypothetical protein [Gemmatimonadota bacterium]